MLTPRFTANDPKADLPVSLENGYHSDGDVAVLGDLVS